MDSKRINDTVERELADARQIAFRVFGPGAVVGDALAVARMLREERWRREERGQGEPVKGCAWCESRDAICDFHRRL